MRRIFLFMNVSLDGYFEGPNHDISFFNTSDDHFDLFSLDVSLVVDTLLFGHRTYDMMKSFWPTPQGQAAQPEIAKFMNERPKIVASRRPFEPGWTNARVISGDVPGQVRQIKAQAGQTIAMFGSNSLCVSLMQAGLVDEFQILLNPVALGAGTPLFAGLEQPYNFRLAKTQAFPSGKMLLTYVPG